MITVTKAYKDASKKPLRQSYVTIKYGLYNKEAKQELSSLTSNSLQPFSSVNDTINENRESALNYISCEPDRVKLDNNFAFIQDKTKLNVNQDIGYWSRYMSDSNGNFTNYPTIIYVLENPITFTPLTLYFQEVVKSFNIYYYLNNNLIYTREIRNNTLITVDTTDSSNLEPIQYFDKVEIAFLSTQTPYRYIKFNEIDFGASMTFKSSEIKEFNIIEEIDLTSDSLPSNSLDATIQDDKGYYDILNPNNKIGKLQKGQQLSVHHYLKVGNVFKELLLGTFLLKKVSTENMKLKLECYDELYFMNSTYYGSKFYINEKATKVFEDLFTYFNYSNKRYSFSDDIQNVYLTGYVPQVSFREALRLIAESCKAIIQKKRTGSIYIYKQQENPIIVNYFGVSDYKNDNVKQVLYNNVADINVYSYDRVEEDIIYSATLNKGTYRVNFSHYPIVYSEYEVDPNTLKSIANANYTIIELNAVGCLVEVSSDNTTVELKGKYYVETSSTERIKKDNSLEVDESAITKIDNHLITNSNYLEIANWKLDKSNINYELKYKTTPYIEVGDKCKLETKYKDSINNSVVKTFVISKIEYDNSIMQSIKGE